VIVRFMKQTPKQGDIPDDSNLQRVGGSSKQTPQQQGDIPDSNSQRVGGSSSEQQQAYKDLAFTSSKCNICLCLMHEAVTIWPCLHSFCGGCLSRWYRRQVFEVIIFHIFHILSNFLTYLMTVFFFFSYAAGRIVLFAEDPAAKFPLIAKSAGRFNPFWISIQVYIKNIANSIYILILCIYLPF